MRAYILLKVTPQDTATVMRDLKNDPHITEAAFIHGPHDCIVQVEAKNLEGVNETVMQIRSMQGVLDTMTCLVVQSWQRPSQ